MYRLSQFSGLMGIGLVLAAIVHKILPTAVVLGEYGYPSEQFGHIHHISSVFLPIGYSVFMGTWISLCHGDFGLVAANVVIYLVWICVVWLVMEKLKASSKQAFWTALGFSFYPDILFSIHRPSHTTTSSLLLLAFVGCVIYLVQSRTLYRADVLMGLLMGVAVLVRPNYPPLLLLAWFLMWKYKLPKMVIRAVLQLVLSFAIYASVTVLVHGSVFWPQNGAYNLFQGANEYTESSLLLYQDAERSMIPALRDRGIIADQDWGRDDNLPGGHDIRNLTYRRLYLHEALYFIRTHKWTMVKLTGLKLLTLLRPDLLYYRALSLQGLVKILLALSFPLWLGAYFFLPRPGTGVVGLVVPLTIMTYILPFLITIGAPHFRIPLDVLCDLEIVAMVLAWLRRAKGHSLPVLQIASP